VLDFLVRFGGVLTGIVGLQYDSMFGR